MHPDIDMEKMFQDPKFKEFVCQYKNSSPTKSKPSSLSTEIISLKIQSWMSIPDHHNLTLLIAAVTDNIPSNADITPGKALTWAHFSRTSQWAVYNLKPFFQHFLDVMHEDNWAISMMASVYLADTTSKHNKGGNANFDPIKYMCQHQSKNMKNKNVIQVMYVQEDDHENPHYQPMYAPDKKYAGQASELKTTTKSAPSTSSSMKVHDTHWADKVMAQEEAHVKDEAHMAKLGKLVPAKVVKTHGVKAKTEAKHHIESDDDDDNSDNGGSKIMSRPAKLKGGTWDKAAAEPHLVPEVILPSTLTTPALAKLKHKANNEAKADDPKVKQHTSGQTRKLSSHTVAAADSSKSELKDLPKGKGNKKHIANDDEYEDKTKEAPKDKVEPPPPCKTKKGKPQPESEVEELEVQAPVKSNKQAKAPPSSKCKLNNPKPKSKVDKLKEDELLVKHKTELVKKTNKPKETLDESVLLVKECARRKMHAPHTPTPEPEPEPEPEPKEIEPQQGKDEEEQPCLKSKPLPKPEEEPEAVVPPQKDQKEEQAESHTKQSKHNPAPSSSIPKPASDDYRPSMPDGNQVIRSYQMKSDKFNCKSIMALLATSDANMASHSPLPTPLPCLLPLLGSYWYVDPAPMSLESESESESEPKLPYCLLLLLMGSPMPSHSKSSSLPKILIIALTAKECACAEMSLQLEHWHYQVALMADHWALVHCLISLLVRFRTALVSSPFMAAQLIENLCVNLQQAINELCTSEMITSVWLHCNNTIHQVPLPMDYD
ncbi:hypothetical protein FRC11_009568 [Ceratobasidium sp. 423]|nr:hypothetical protein FRC11_009568 [Ceratobasidium sp. 423]